MRTKVYKKLAGGGPGWEYDPRRLKSPQSTVAANTPIPLSGNPTTIRPGARALTTTISGRTSPDVAVNSWEKPSTTSNVFSKFGDIVPYISNIANSFRRAPRPAAPGQINPIATRKVNFDNQRAETDRTIIGANANVDRNLDENTAQAFKAANRVQGMRAKNAIAESETNTNAQMGAQTDQTNAAIQGQNIAMTNQWRNNITEAQVADQNNQSANLANAADKYIMQENNRTAADLDKRRLGVYKGMFASSGVMDRQITGYQKYLKDNGLEDTAVKAYGGKMRKKAFKC